MLEATDECPLYSTPMHKLEIKSGSKHQQFGTDVSEYFTFYVSIQQKKLAGGKDNSRQDL